MYCLCSKMDVYKYKYSSRFSIYFFNQKSIQDFFKNSDQHESTRNSENTNRTRNNLFFNYEPEVVIIFIFKLATIKMKKNRKMWQISWLWLTFWKYIKCIAKIIFQIVIGLEERTVHWNIYVPIVKCLLSTWSATKQSNVTIIIFYCL